MELERTDSGIKAGLRDNSTLPRKGSVDDTAEKDKSEIKSVIVQCTTEEQRDSIIQEINKIIKRVKKAADIFANPKGEGDYAKKCQCATISIT